MSGITESASFLGSAVSKVNTIISGINSDHFKKFNIPLIATEDGEPYFVHCSKYDVSTIQTVIGNSFECGYFTAINDLANPTAKIFIPVHNIKEVYWNREGKRFEIDGIY